MATGTIKNPQAASSSQTLTKTNNGQTITGVFNRFDGAVFVRINSTGNTNFGNDWQACFTGLNAEFRPTADVIATVGQAPSHSQGFRIKANASTVEINMANTSAWVEGSFVYYINL